MIVKADIPLRRFESPTMDVTGRSILITGGTGSFGSAFVRRLLTIGPPRRLVIFSRDEQKQQDLQRRFAGQPGAESLRFFIGDVRDRDRLELAMRGIEFVVHAAAIKIVPTAEYNPFECVLTNIHGAENVVKSALRTGVRHVLALSTDKAANPINLYGATKLASDKIMVAANNLSGEGGARFSVVRYGNVIGSRGSVVPLYQDLIARGAKSLPVTDQRMSRFWITIDQGVSFVLSCLSMMAGGEIFVPKIPSMRIVDLARALAPTLPQETIGIRPGEKLHEVMITEDDTRSTLELDDRYVICPSFEHWTDEHLKRLGSRAVPEAFRYSSDSNPEWLDALGLAAVLNKSSATASR
jgi:UDP-N-acetylglucosamine 4,6-dehydratase/5-epimerase